MARAEPVVVGIREVRALRARRRSLWNPSTGRWVLVMSCRVVIEPWRMPKLFVHHLHHRCQAVGGAGGGGHQPVHGGVVEVVVDAVDDVQRLGAGHLALHWAGHHHPAQAAALEVRRQGVWGPDGARALQHHLHTRPGPGHRGRITAAAPAHGVLADPEDLAVGVHRLLPAAMHGVEAEQMGRGGGIAGVVVDVDHLDAGTAPEGPEQEATDAAEAVDADPHGRTFARE